MHFHSYIFVIKLPVAQFIMPVFSSPFMNNDLGLHKVPHCFLLIYQHVETEYYLVNVIVLKTDLKVKTDNYILSLCLEVLT